ncbi:MAG: hypothetical protein J6386_19480 [Candidatus Synoicihabitans palmerolidicus]|nr:hypothetical protein [Candidatus Synoicihabitans palmerolidicus]
MRTAFSGISEARRVSRADSVTLRRAWAGGELASASRHGRIVWTHEFAGVAGGGDLDLLSAKIAEKQFCRCDKGVMLGFAEIELVDDSAGGPRSDCWVIGGVGQSSGGERSMVGLIQGHHGWARRYIR